MLRFKTCHECHHPKLISEFRPDSTYKSGYQSRCIPCVDKLASERAAVTGGWTCRKCGNKYKTSHCRPCQTAYGRKRAKGRPREIKEWRAQQYQKDKATPGWLDKHYAKGRMTYERIRQLVFEAYGNKCYCCGLDDWRFLTIDHALNDGHKDRYPSGKRVIAYTCYKEALAAFGTGRFQLACFNCNCARSCRGSNGICPHQLDKQAANERAA